MPSPLCVPDTSPTGASAKACAHHSVLRPPQLSVKGFRCLSPLPPLHSPLCLFSQQTWPASPGAVLWERLGPPGLGHAQPVLSSRPLLLPA